MVGWTMAMALGSFQCHGVLLIWIKAGQGPTVLVDACWCSLYTVELQWLEHLWDYEY